MVPALILDLILVAVLVLFIALGARRGLVLTLCGLLALFVAFFGAAYVSNALCEPMADVIQPAIESHLDEALQREAASSVAGTVPKVEDLPLEELLEALKSSGAYQSLADSFQEAVHQGVAQVTGSAAQSLSRYIARTVAGAILFVLSFLVILIVARFYEKFRKSKTVTAVMTGLRPTVIGLIAASLLSIGREVFFPAAALPLPAVLLSVLLFLSMAALAFKKVHPIAVIAISAAVGILAGFCLGL